MEPSALSDPELLADWLGRQREPAFHALVARYAGLVHATARRTCGDDSMAAEASQLTFITLARKAKSLTSCASLGGWLHTTALMQAKNLIRKSHRENRKRQLLQAAMETDPPHASNDVWQEMQPVLDEALAALSAKDREALLLRFYRSLSIREIAGTLGIATDAAQKRIDRATERLRGKLARRGVQAGGSLSAAMLAGFTADAQAAGPAVSLLASKAIAAGAAGVGFIPASAALFATVMKTTSLIPPVVALLIVGGWIGTQRQSIASLDKESALLRTHLANARASVGSGASSFVRTPDGKPAKDKQPIDWKKVAAQMAEMQRNYRMGDSRALTHLEQRVESMTKEELVAALDEIAKLDLPPGPRQALGPMFIGPLLEKDPELGLNYFAASLQGSVNCSSWQLATALGKWLQKDPGQATAWLDEQIAAGKFDSKSLDGKNPVRLLFEGEMIRLLVGSDIAGAEARLAKLPEDQWKEIFRGESAREVKEQDQKAFADLMRRRLSEEETNQAIAQIASNVVPKGYPEVSAYLDRIAATPQERATSANTAATTQMMQDASRRIITREDIDKMREWVTAESPGTADATTGKALAAAVSVSNGTLKFADAAALALQYQARSGNDDVLVNFLGGGQAGQNKEESIKLAEKISDPTRREEVLKKLN